MCENFTNDFMVKLDGKIPDDAMAIVLKELQMHVCNFEIEKKTTDVVLYQDIIPKCYKIYMVSKKIEGFSETTLKAYDLILNDFLIKVRKKLEDITSNDIRVYLYESQEIRNVSLRTVENWRKVINAFLEWCRGEGYIKLNPCRQISPIRYEKKLREPLSGVEMELVRYACQSQRERAIIEILYSTGCRVTELSNLNRSDVDFSNGEVHLFGKGKKHRISYMNAKSEVALKKYLETRTDLNDSLFVSQKSPYGRLKKNAIELIVRKVGERAGIERRLFPHLIRHTTATDAIDRGMDVTELQKILGHADLETTMIYAKISQENVKRSHKKYIV